ncbi:WxcM-like domain-containing protein [Rouxiella sp. S1S-2]|uniref:sugar 3,4-ketoisomerase n=1 Tax=Rouxiella sp. S1S-2 TaxID=2653856 RepID=UPI0012642758|nr:FdtA/QdtA family cupin domain-containing protein [Rouxiella sp. S1S-2]KAB7897119.1 WxcM-like domain-containing protein [Rouxiella sp. S1S-2]
MNLFTHTDEKDSLQPPQQAVVDLVTFTDERGCLVSVESMNQVPFDIKRLFYIFNTNANQNRGFHAHRRDKQFLICLVGKLRVRLNDGTKISDHWLDSPSKGLLVKDMVWVEMHDFSKDCALVVLASEKYDKTDYIHDYDVFVAEAKERNEN